MQSEALPVVYLAGAIRDGVAEDIQWRERLINTCHGLAIFLNPCAGKFYDPETKLWTIHGRRSTGKYIVKQDFWCVDRTNIGVFNFLALADKYPNIGTLIEFGRMTLRGALIFSIVPPDYLGHENAGTYTGLHPFLAETNALVFPTVDECIEFLRYHLAVLSGRSPYYNGTLE